MPTAKPRPSRARSQDARAELEAVLDRLGVDELRVLTSIAKRLRLGARVYGRLLLSSDKRAFRPKEAREELEDFLVYLACAWLQALETPRPKTRAPAAGSPARRR